MRCPWGAPNEPITLPFLSMWIIDGGRTQQSATGGVSSASSSISVRSFGRSYTQTLSSLSTASPVIPPIFHLFGSGFGQSGSNLNFGAVSVGAPRSARKTPAPKNTTQKVKSEKPANLAQAFVPIPRIFTVPSAHVTMLHVRILQSILGGVYSPKFSVSTNPSGMVTNPPALHLSLRACVASRAWAQRGAL